MLQKAKCNLHFFATLFFYLKNMHNYQGVAGVNLMVGSPLGCISGLRPIVHIWDLGLHGEYPPWGIFLRGGSSNKINT